jgi:hypothetical protein
MTMMARLHRRVKRFKKFLVLLRKPKAFEASVFNRAHTARQCVGLVLAGLFILIGPDNS